MIAIAEVKRALVIIDHHLAWTKKELDLTTATELNRLVRDMANQAEDVYKRCRITLCQTCDVLLALHPEMDRMDVHRKHKIDSRRL